jgi:RNA polymerase-binding protein DksA
MAKTLKKKPAARKSAPVKKSSLKTKKPQTSAKGSVKKNQKQAAKKPAVLRQQYSKSDLQRFREIILEKRKEILEELESLKSNMMDVTTGEYVAENSTYSLHMEQGTDAMEREKTFLFASREGRFLNYLDDALRRIEKGTYGNCTDCGKLIERERLEAVPHSQLCMTCKLKKGAK